MTNAAKTLVAVAILAVALAAVVVGGGMAFFRAATSDTQTHLYPASPAFTVWSTHWAVEAAPVFASALMPEDPAAPPVALGQTLYALGSDRRLHALDPATGAIRWEFGYQDGRRIVNFRATPARLVLLVRQLDPATGLATSDLVGLDPITHLPAWDRLLDTDIFAGSLEVTGDSVYLAVADNVDGEQYRGLLRRSQAPSLHPRVRAYALGDGRSRWEQLLPERPDQPAIARVSLVTTDREVVATERGASRPLGLASLDSDGGAVLWKDLSGSEAIGVTQGGLVIRTGTDLAITSPGGGRTVQHVPSLAPPPDAGAVVDRTVLYGTFEDEATAVDLGAGRRLWTTALDFPRGGFGSRPGRTRPPAVAGGHLYLGGRDEAVYSIDVRTGAVEWKFPAPVAPATADSAPVRYADLVLVQDAQLVAYAAPR